MDQELKLIEGLLAVVKSAAANTDLGPIEIARAAEYVAERCYQARDEHETRLAEEKAEEERFRRFTDLSHAKHELRKAIAMQSGCQCSDCQRLRGERFDA